MSWYKSSSTAERLIGEQRQWDLVEDLAQLLLGCRCERSREDHVPSDDEIALLLGGSRLGDGHALAWDSRLLVRLHNLLSVSVTRMTFPNKTYSFWKSDLNPTAIELFDLFCDRSSAFGTQKSLAEGQVHPNDQVIVYTLEATVLLLFHDKDDRSI